MRDPDRSSLDPSYGQDTAGLAHRWRFMPSGVAAVVFLLCSALVVLAAAVTLGYLLSKYLTDDAPGEADRFVTHWMARHRTKDLNETTHWATYLSETPTVVVAGLLLAGTARAVWKRWRESLFVVAALVGEVSIFLVTTLLVDRRRPSGVSHLDAAPPTSSFFSGHTAAAVVLYGVLAVLAIKALRGSFASKIFGLLAFVIPAVVSIARLYRGMHFMTDVLTGAAVGAVWLFIAARGVRLGVAHRELARHSVTRSSGEPLPSVDRP
nr:phosphatase PAP2 family protein [Actinomycetota bacterium]